MSLPELWYVLAAVGGAAAVAVVIVLVARQLGRPATIIVGALGTVLALGIVGTGWYAWATQNRHDTFDVYGFDAGDDQGHGLSVALPHDRVSTSGAEYDFRLLRGSDAADVHSALVATGTPVEATPGGWTLVQDGLRYTVVERADGTWHAARRSLLLADGNDLTEIAFPDTDTFYRADVGTPARLPMPAADVRAELELLGATPDGPDTLIVPTDDGRTARLTFDGDVMTADIVGDAPVS